jgi:hypothetical protein
MQTGRVRVVKDPRGASLARRETPRCKTQSLSSQPLPVETLWKGLHVNYRAKAFWPISGVDPIFAAAVVTDICRKWSHSGWPCDPVLFSLKYWR